MWTQKNRRALIYWLYAVSLGHLIMGIALPLLIHLPIFDAYHRIIETEFWTTGAPLAARAQQIWWISLFGATIQNVGIWMAALIRLGDQHRSRFAWMSLLLGVLVWAPQDIWISYSAGVMMHVWIDLLALLCIVPALLLLWRIDENNPNIVR